MVFSTWVSAMPEGIEYWLISTVDDKGNKALTGGMMKRLMPETGTHKLC